VVGLPIRPEAGEAIAGDLPAETSSKRLLEVGAESSPLARQVSEERGASLTQEIAQRSWRRPSRGLLQNARRLSNQERSARRISASGGPGVFARRARALESRPERAFPATSPERHSDRARPGLVRERPGRRPVLPAAGGGRESPAAAHDFGKPTDPVQRCGLAAASGTGTAAGRCWKRLDLAPKPTSVSDDPRQQPVAPLRSAAPGVNEPEG